MYIYIYIYIVYYSIQYTIVYIHDNGAIYICTFCTHSYADDYNTKIHKHINNIKLHIDNINFFKLISPKQTILPKCLMYH